MIGEGQLVRRPIVQDPHDRAVEVRLGDARHDAGTAVGELDLVLPPRYSQELADRIPNARLVVIPEVGHQPFQEAPGDYNALLVDFWQSLA